MAKYTDQLLARLESLSPNMFAQEIERIHLESGLSYIQAVLYYCEKYGVDIAAVPELINSTLRDKIQNEGEELHLLPKTSRLPL